MPVEDVFSISGRGTVVTGRIERGIVKVVKRSRSLVSRTRQDNGTGVEMFRKLLDQGEAGDNVGVLLRGTKREDVERGQVLCKPGRSHRTRSLRQRSTCWVRMKVVVIRHFSRTTVHSSTSVQRM